MKKDPQVYLYDILESIKQIELYCQNLTQSQFESDLKTQDATFRRLEIIGEAARNISRIERDQYPQIPWQEIIGTRDKLIHGYSQIDYDLVWEIIKRDLPDLKEKISAIV